MQGVSTRQHCAMTLNFCQKVECEAPDCRQAQRLPQIRDPPADELAMQKAAMLAEFEAAMGGSAAKPLGEQLLDEIMQDNVDGLRTIIESDPGCLGYTNLSGQTPLATAVQWGKDECCSLLLEAKTDVNAANALGGGTVLHKYLAISGDNPLLPGVIRCAEVLLAHKAEMRPGRRHWSWSWKKSVSRWVGLCSMVAPTPMLLAAAGASLMPPRCLNRPRRSHCFSSIRATQRSPRASLGCDLST